MHLKNDAQYNAHLSNAVSCLRSAQESLRGFPDIAGAGFLHDAEKEVAEAYMTRCLVAGETLPNHKSIGVRVAAWLNGLAEAASEVRRSMLDELRNGQTTRAVELFASMEGAFDFLVTVDYPDAITGGLRRSADALRAVVERSRSDLTTTLIQERLRVALTNQAPSQST